MRFLRWLLWWRPPCLLKRVGVNFTHDPDQALVGVLWSVRGPWLVLRDVTANVRGNPPEPLQAEYCVIERAKVSFLEVLS